MRSRRAPPSRACQTGRRRRSWRPGAPPAARSSDHYPVAASSYFGVWLVIQVARHPAVGPYLLQLRVLDRAARHGMWTAWMERDAGWTLHNRRGEAGDAPDLALFVE